jgi:integrase
MSKDTDSKDEGDNQVDLSDGKWHPVRGHPGIFQRLTKKGELRWGARAYDPATKNSRWLGTFDTRRDAKEAKREAESAPRLERRMRVRDYAALWLDLHSGDRRESTLRTLKYGVRPFVKRFGDRWLHQLKRIECVAWANEVGNWAVGPARVMLNDALSDELLHRNPLANLRHQQPRGRRDMTVISTEELHRIIEMAPEVLGKSVGAMMGDLLWVLGYEGVRQGEAFALQSERIDLTERELEIATQIERVTCAHVKPKTGPRIIALLPQAQAALERRRRAQNGSPLLFTTPAGTPFTPSKIAYYWHQLRAAAGYHGMQLHELRHYHATWLAYQGVPEWAIEIQLGHGSKANAWRRAAELGARRRLEPEESRNPTTKRYLHREKLAILLILKAATGPTTPIPRDPRSAPSPGEAASHDDEGGAARAADE